MQYHFILTNNSDWSFALNRYPCECISDRMHDAIEEWLFCKDTTTLSDWIDNVCNVIENGNVVGKITRKPFNP